MNINGIGGSYGGYLNTSSIKSSTCSKNNLGSSLGFKDSIDISTSRNDIYRARDIGGIILDKGTAANTTLYVDKSSFFQIMNYTTNNTECKWSELGIDDEKRWIVVNGQRFECPLSEEEKEARRKLRRTLLDVFEEADKEKEKHNSKSEKHNFVQLSLGQKNKIKVEGDDQLQENDKIKNLMSNDKVMKMLTCIMNKNGGQ
jgi:hypothetical protein